jgi:hypothetical protein
MNILEEGTWQDAVYRNRRCRIEIDNVIARTPSHPECGPLVDYGDGLLFRVSWGDENLIIDPTDDDLECAEPMYERRLPGVRIDEDGTGYVVVEPDGQA